MAEKNKALIPKPFVILSLIMNIPNISTGIFVFCFRLLFRPINTICITIICMTSISQPIAVSICDTAGSIGVTAAGYTCRGAIFSVIIYRNCPTESPKNESKFKRGPNKFLASTFTSFYTCDSITFFLKKIVTGIKWSKSCPKSTICIPVSF